MFYRLISFVGIVFFSCQLFAQNDPILMRVGNSEVKVSEFKYIYEKNNGADADYSEKSINDYLDLYTKFKLKVEKAKELRLDTISALKTELDGYRRQLASSYLIDKEVTDFLLKELYSRMGEDVEFAHIFIPVPENTTHIVKEEAKDKLREVKSKLVGGMKFEDAAKEFSQDKSSATKGGQMGFFTAKLPSGFYALETALYTTPIGQVSDIIETRIGFHIIKVLSKRPARGTIEVAHILIDPEKAKLADSIYNAANAGADFDKLAAQYSVDKNTSKNGGKLPPFGINMYDKIFEDAAFRITTNGQIAPPVMTKSGWHIIKRINKPAQDSYDIFIRKMKSQINKDQRFDAAKIKLVEDIKKAAGYKQDKFELSKFTNGLNEEFYSYKWSPSPVVDDKMLFSLGGDQVYKISDFANFCKKNTKTRLKYDKSKPLYETVDELFNEYVNESAMAYEEKNLEVKYPDFKSLMREYEEGILLFEATKIHVWDKANQDTTGIKSFFENVKNNYIWPEKAGVTEVKISDVDKDTAEKIYKFVAKDDFSKLDKKFNKKKKIVATNEAQYEKGSKELASLEWKDGAMSPLQADPSKTTYSFLKIKNLIPSRSKTLSEARGYVVADYQDYLEKEWIKSLTKEINVVIYKDVIHALKK